MKRRLQALALTLIPASVFGTFSQTCALEIMASFTTYGSTITLRDSAGAGGTNIVGISGSHGGQPFFSALSLSAGTSNGTMTSVTPVATDTPTFNGIPNTTDGVPTTSAGSFLALTLTRNAFYPHQALDIAGIWLALFVSSGTGTIDLHPYASASTTGTGAGTPSGTWTTSLGMMNAVGHIANTTAPTAASYFAFTQNAIIPAGANGANFEIRLAIDKAHGHPSDFALVPFSNILDGAGTGNAINLGASSVFAIVTTPEPGTYVLAASTVITIGLIEARRRWREVKQPQTF